MTFSLTSRNGHAGDHSAYPNAQFTTGAEVAPYGS